MTTLEDLLIKEAYSASLDHSAWYAFLVLQNEYNSLTYWSMDGYHVHALADYSRDIVWLDASIVRWSTKEVMETVDDFYTCSTQVITNTWKQAVNKYGSSNTYTGTGSDYLDCVLGVGGFEKWGPITGDGK